MAAGSAAHTTRPHARGGEPGKAKNAREVGEAVIHKHRVLVEEGYSDDQAWAIAYDMVAKSEHARPALADHAIDSKAHQDMVAELVSKGMSEEQAAQVVKRRMKGLTERLPRLRLAHRTSKLVHEDADGLQALLHLRTLNAE